MSETLDLAVAQVIFRARQIERALHDRGPWEVEMSGLRVPACRMIFRDRVVFLAHFPEHCWIDRGQAQMTLLCDGEIVGLRVLPDHPGDGEFKVTWEMRTRPALSVVR